MRLIDVTEETWARLTEAAVEAMGRAYAPYSGFSVGAAALTDDGRVVSGCNVENAAYGVTLCAECSLVSELFATGGGTLRAFVCVNGDGEPLAPCGRCRQLLFEHKGPELLLATPAGVLTMEQVLPGAFGPEDLS
ncbi:cytidine deaminase [Arthrobacter sp. UM1]|uniref:cytidine deaminase n=1 Tax=Arthrobacter sp. UM1 TaxID=2766776 RepID=UPI001CF680D6|nr:cytidine deaminase [Arthrobacter sp. UM1]